MPERQYSQLQAGVGGQVYYIEAGRRRRSRRRSAAVADTLQRYRLCDRRAANSSPVSLLMRSARMVESCSIARRRWRRARSWRPRRRHAAGPSSSSSMRIATAAAGPGRLERVAAHVSRAEGRVQTDLQRRLAQPARLSLRAEHARRRLAEDERDVRPVAAVRECIAPISTTCSTSWAPRSPIGHSYVRGGDMPDVPQSPGGLLGADFAIENGRYKSHAHLRQRELESRSALAARGARRRTSLSAITSLRSTASS